MAEKIVQGAATATGQSKYIVRDFAETIERIKGADNLLSTSSPDGWDHRDEGDKSILDWNTCNPNLEIPQIRYLSNVGFANGKEHGKRFEENLKLVVSVALSSDELLTKEKSENIIKILNYKRKFKTLPISDTFFLEETEHKNDEKDIDTNQVLNENAVKTFGRSRKIILNPVLKTRTKWEWNYDTEEMKELRRQAGEFMGSGMNIKCAQMSSRGNWNESEVAWPNPIDCANCLTFLQETKEGHFIFVVGVWKYSDSDPNLKCLQGVWFINMLPVDFKLLWGDDVNDAEIIDVSDKITALKRFNKVKQTKKNPGQAQNATLKALYYYGNINDARKRCGDTFIEDDASQEKMAYGGCIPLLNTIKDKLAQASACIRLTPKVQVTKAQARLQCNISTANFKNLVNKKLENGDVIYSEDFNYLFRPIRKIGTTVASFATEAKQGGGGFIQKGGNRINYNRWLDEKKWSESETEFFFDVSGNSYGYPITCVTDIRDSLKEKENGNEILSKLTIFEIPDVITLETSKEADALVEVAEGEKVAEGEEDEEKDYIEFQDGLDKHDKILRTVGKNLTNQLEKLRELMEPFKQVNEMPRETRDQRRQRRTSSQSASDEFLNTLDFERLKNTLLTFKINVNPDTNVKILRKYHFALKILNYFPKNKSMKEEFMVKVSKGKKNNYKLLTELVNGAFTVKYGTPNAVNQQIKDILKEVKMVDPPEGHRGGRKKRTRKKRRRKKKSRRKRRK